jgi:hypothetical protein
MSLSFYKILHIIGIMMLFLGIGGAIVRSRLAEGKEMLEKFVLMNHGLGLLIVLIAGFGQLAKIGMEFSGWVIVKIVIWLAMGALIMPIKKKPSSGTMVWYIALGLGALAGYLAIFKPF